MSYHIDMSVFESNPITHYYPIQKEGLSYYAFRHPKTHDMIWVPGDKTPAERLRYICQTEGIKDERNRNLFLALFPEDLPTKDSTEESVMHHENTHLNPNLKSIRNSFNEEIFGYISPRKINGTVKSSAQEDLHVRMLDDSFVGRISELPVVKRLKGVNQTYPNMGDNPPHKSRTRYEHSLHMGRAYTQTLTRFALLQPDLFIESVQTAIKEVSAENFDSLIQQIDAQNLDIDVSSLTDEQISSLKYAKWYGKIGLLYVMLHDAYTPGFGDRFMKAKARFSYEKGVDFSEDEMLRTSISDLAINDPDIRKLLADFDMDSALIVPMIESYASEGDTTLNGLMLKAKLKGAMPVFGSKAKSKLDLDQESGTIANTVGLVNLYFPGGHTHKKREDPMPIGSFEERTRLLGYMMLTDFTKEELHTVLAQIGFDDEMQKRIYIAAEEYTMWHNMELRKIKNSNGEENIAPVSLVPGDFKKATLIQNVLYSMFYRGVEMDVCESLFQRILVNYLYDEGGHDPVLTIDDFIGKTDHEVIGILRNKAPELVYILRTFEDRGRILTEEEYRDLLHSSQSNNSIILAIREKSFGVTNEKPGTIAVDDKDETRLAYEILDRTRNTYYDNPFSIVKRIEGAGEATAGQKFKVLELSNEEWRELTRLLTNSGHKDIFLRGLRHWMRHPQFVAHSE